MQRPEWHSQAPCNGKVALFYPSTNDRASAERLTLQARSICCGCPFTAQCAAEDDANVARYGGARVWRVVAGELRGYGREPQHRARGPIPGVGRKAIHHGTAGGYQAHRRHGEPICQPCRAAHARARSEERAKDPIWFYEEEAS